MRNDELRVCARQGASWELIVLCEHRDLNAFERAACETRHRLQKKSDSRLQSELWLVHKKLEIHRYAWERELSVSQTRSQHFFDYSIKDYVWLVKNCSRGFNTSTRFNLSMDMSVGRRCFWRASMSADGFHVHREESHDRPKGYAVRII